MRTPKPSLLDAPTLAPRLGGLLWPTISTHETIRSLRCGCDRRLVATCSLSRIENPPKTRRITADTASHRGVLSVARRSLGPIRGHLGSALRSHSRLAPDAPILSRSRQPATFWEYVHGRIAGPGESSGVGGRGANLGPSVVHDPLADRTGVTVAGGGLRQCVRRPSCLIVESTASLGSWPPPA